MVEQFGTDHIYGADTFNEMTPSSSDPAYLSSVSNAVFTTMTSGNHGHLGRQIILVAVTKLTYFFDLKKINGYSSNLM